MSGDLRRNASASFLCFIVFLLAAGSIGAADTIPMPRERPKTAPGGEIPSSQAAAAPSPCQLRLAEVAVFDPLPPIAGPGECKATDVVKIEAVRLPDKQRIILSPPATLRCPMAEAVAQWVTDGVAPAIAAIGASLRGIETADSFDCRPRNGIKGAKISEHGHANALDVRSFKLAKGKVIELNNPSVPKSLREKFRDSACARFSTVLGNGADAYHDTHVHLDMIERSNHYKICQWDVLDPAETAALAEEKAATAAARIPVEFRIGSAIPLPLPRPMIGADFVRLPQQSPRRNANEGVTQTDFAPSLVASSAISDGPSAPQETVTVGPWNVATSYKGDKFISCSMSRSSANLNIIFRRTDDGLFLLLASQKWKLEQGKAYSVRLVAGSRSVEAQALAGLDSATIALADRSLDGRLRTTNVLEVRGEGATLRVPLDGSRPALDRLESCFDKNSRSSVETNPFVAPSRKP
jgi:Extensin-like protein C-terminus